MSFLFVFEVDYLTKVGRYILPPFISPFVQIAHIESAVSVVTTALNRMIIEAKPIPA